MFKGKGAEFGENAVWKQANTKDGDDGVDMVSFCFSLFILPAYEVRRTADKTAVFEVISGSPGRVLLGVGLCFAVAE